MSAQSQPSVNVEAVGKVMATLDDVRLILYVAIVLIVVLVLKDFWTAAGMRADRKEMRAERETLRAEAAKEREKMWEVADKFGEAAEKIGEQTDKLVIELQVLRAISARVEGQVDVRG
jgi:FtsZ-interacting cell division protein ZipA